MAQAKKSTEGVHDTEPYKSTVDESAYPARPYGEAISKEHKAWLAENAEVRVTPSVESAADVGA